MNKHNVKQIMRNLTRVKDVLNHVGINSTNFEIGSTMMYDQFTSYQLVDEFLNLELNCIFSDDFNELRIYMMDLGKVFINCETNEGIKFLDLIEGTGDGIMFNDELLEYEIRPKFVNVDCDSSVIRFL